MSLHFNPSQLARRLALVSGVSLVALLAACGDVAPPEPSGRSTQAAEDDGKGEDKSDPTGIDEPDPKSGLLPWASHSFRKRAFNGEELAKDAMDNRIQIKFKVGSGVRARGGDLMIDKEKATEPDFNALDAARSALDTHGHKASVRMHTLSEDYLERSREEGQKRTGRDVPDLNLWVYSYVEPKDAEHLALLLEELNENPIVELAYPCYLPVHSGLGKAAQAATKALKKLSKKAQVPSDERIAEIDKGFNPKVTRVVNPPGLPTPPPAPPGDYSPLQYYAGEWPAGINAISAQQSYIGAYGTNGGYGDVEYAWRTTHQDLTNIGFGDLVNGTPHSSVNVTDFRNHGTAVAGMLSATDNGFGVTGLTSEAYVRLSTEFPGSGHNRPGAVSTASANLWPGGAILLEMQTFAGFDCNGDNIAASDYNQAPLPDFVPAEHEPAVKDAVKFATAAGRHVIATGGNGGCDLDLPGFLGAFAMYDEANLAASVNAHDSGAVFVGAGGKDVPAAYWTDFSTYGTRFDTQAQGDYQIVTTGYGDLYNNLNDEDTFYTDTFAGTSGAGPIITGAVVAMEGVLFNNHGAAYTPKELRRILRRHSTVADLRYRTVWEAQNPPPGSDFVLRGRIARPDLNELNEPVNARHFCGRSSDFDGDGKADYATYRTSKGFAGLWRIRFSGGGEETFQWGQYQDIPCPADVLGDGRTELVVYRPSTQDWHILNLQDQTQQIINYGAQGDIPIALDFDGDGKANLAVYDRYSNFPYAEWYIRAPQGGTLITLPVGVFESTPLTADLDNDGADDLITYNSGSGQWEIAETTNLNFSYFVNFGQPGDIPRIRQQGGDAHLAVYRSEEGKLYTRNSNTFQVTSESYGTPGDIPILADVSSGSDDEVIVFRAPYAKTWVMDNNQPIFYQKGTGVVWSTAYETTLIPVMQ